MKSPESILDLIDSLDPWIDQIVEWLNRGYTPIAVAYVFNVTQFSVEYLISDPHYPILSEAQRTFNRLQRERDESEIKAAKRLLSQLRKVVRNEQSKVCAGM